MTYVKEGKILDADEDKRVYIFLTSKMGFRRSAPPKQYLYWKHLDDGTSIYFDTYQWIMFAYKNDAKANMPPLYTTVPMQVELILDTKQMTLEDIDDRSKGIRNDKDGRELVTRRG